MDKVYIVDDEKVFCTALESVLEILDFDVTSFNNATDAYEYFTSSEFNPQKARILLDVTLSGGKDQERFGRSNTQNFTVTGTTLADLLLEERIFTEGIAKRVILYTANYTTEIWPKMEIYSEKNNVRLWRKTAVPNLEEILELLGD